MFLSITKNDRKLSGRVELPSSKSISNRLLIIRSLCDMHFHIDNLSFSDDTVLMKDLLRKIKEYEGVTLELDAKNAGTVFRFLTAFLAITPGNYILTGDERMKQRPVGALVDALKHIGADIQYHGETGYPPLKINGRDLQGGELEIDASISSQFISALLMVSPEMKENLRLGLKGRVSSKPYIRMTIKLMKQLGAEVEWNEDSIIVNPKPYHGGTLRVEADWSSASYWYLMAAFSDELSIHLNGLRRDSLQGDAIVADIFTSFGVHTEFTNNGITLTKKGNTVKDFSFDFSKYPDLAQSVAVCCSGLNIPAQLWGLKSLRIKETDRLVALKNELNKIGSIVEITEDELIIQPANTKGLQPLVSNNQGNSFIINTYNDHRMAMAFAPLAIIYPEIIVEKPEVVTKSYPGFWEDLQKAGFEIEFHAKTAKSVW